ncbi:MAG: MATE family efflux transporter [Lachnospira sp.]|nr:MATE family efflux transporter [Lachnospira sp.]
MNNKEFIKIVAPITFQYLMTSLVSASDAFMLGFLDQNSLAAASLATQIAFIYSLFFTAFVMGFNVMAAQYWGKGDRITVEKVITISMRYTLLVGIVFSLITLLFPEQVMHLFTTDKAIIVQGALYLRAVSLSYVLTGFAQIYFGVLKVCNHAGLSSLIGSLSVVVNIGLNAILIFGLLGMPKLGIVGAALATVLARIFETVFVILVLQKYKCPRTRLKYLFLTNEKILHSAYWKYTVPLLVNQLGWGGGITMYSVIMGHLGSDATAANSIASIVRSMIASLCWGIAAGVSIIIGGTLGRNQLEEAKRLGSKYVRLSIVIGVGSGIVILMLIPLVVHVVTLSNQAVYYLKAMLCMAAYYIIGNSLNSTIISGIFPAGGDTRFGMICDLITLWIVIVPMGMLAAFVFHAPVLVVAFILTLDEFVKIPAVYMHYVKYKWVCNITKEVP